VGQVGGVSRGSRRVIGLGPVLVAFALGAAPTSAQASASSPHYYKGLLGASILSEGKRVPVVSFGTLTFHTPQSLASKPRETCHVVLGGWVENPRGSGSETGHSGPPGVGETQTFDAYECEGTECYTATGFLYYESTPTVPAPYRSAEEPGGNATNLAWKSELKIDATAKRAEPTIRSDARNEQIDIQCHFEEGRNFETGEIIWGAFAPERFEGSLQPWTGLNHSTLSPSYPQLVFDRSTEEDGEGSAELHGPPPSEEGDHLNVEGVLNALPYDESGVLDTKVG
jgi:hypothetical protein